MKSLVLVLSGIFLLSFTNMNDTIEGVWIGAFKSDVDRENMVVKFVSGHEMEIYSGEVKEEKKVVVSYKLEGDSALHFTFKSPEGDQVTMHGTINKRKNFMEGSWETSDNRKGEFFLRKQRIQEMYVQP